MAQEAIFIGYRRDDTADVAGRIYDALAARFGEERVFKDVDNIPVGADFAEYIKGILPRCRVALILIGRDWLNSADASGRRRLDDEHDWVRLEVETALAAGDIQVVPVLVNGAEVPDAEALPPGMRALVRRNAAVIRRDPDFRDDIERLANALRQSVRTGFLDLGSLSDKRPSSTRSASSRKGGGMLIVGAIMAIALVGLGYGASRWLSSAASPNTTAEAQEADASTPASADAASPPAPAPADTVPQPREQAVERSSPPPVVVQAPVQSSEMRDALMMLDAARVEALIRRGWNPNSPLDSESNAALHDLMHVCERNRTHDQYALANVARVLINAGANKYAANRWGDTPLTIASSPRYCGPNHPVVSVLQ
jgi:hypothetical protein